jgi:hypothetical protein
LDSTEDAWLGDDAAYLNVKEFLSEPGRVRKHILSNDLPMLGVVAGHKYGVAGDSFSQDTEVAPVHILEFKSGSKPTGLQATEVEPASPVHHLIYCSPLPPYTRPGSRPCAKMPTSLDPFPTMRWRGTSSKSTCR